MPSDPITKEETVVKNDNLNPDKEEAIMDDSTEVKTDMPQTSPNTETPALT